MIDYKQKYKEEKTFLIIVIIMNVVTTVILGLNIELRDERIWQLQIENIDLKEQVHMLKGE